MEPISATGKIAGELAGKDDKYLLIYLVVFVIAACGFAIYSIGKRNDRLIAKLETTYESQLAKSESHSEEYRSMTNQLVVTVQKNTEVISEVLEVMKQVNQQIGRCPAREK